MVPNPLYDTEENTRKDTHPAVMRVSSGPGSRRVSATCERSYELAVRECLMSQSMVMSMLTEFLAEIE